MMRGGCLAEVLVAGCGGWHASAVIRLGFLNFLVFAGVGVWCGCSNDDSPSGESRDDGATSGGTGNESGGSLGTGGLDGVGGLDATGGADDAGGSDGTGGLGEAGSGGQATGDPCAGLTLCDDFETTVVDPALWTMETSDGNSMELSSEYAAHGSKSLHLHVQNGFARLRNESVFPMPNNDYFGRMYLRVAKFSTVAWAHWTVGEGAGNGDGSLIRVGGQYNTNAQANRWGVGSDGGPTGDWTMHDDDPPGSPQEPPENSWVCIEWEHKGSANETRFFVQGEEHPSLHTTSSSHGSNNAGSEYILPEMTSFWFGWWQYQVDDSMDFDVWIDLVAIDEERIGCPL